MEIKFKKQYYNETEKNNKGEDKIKEEIKPMYQLTIQADYFTGDKQEVLKQAIADLRQRADLLERIYNQNEKMLDTWDSIEK